MHKMTGFGDRRDHPRNLGECGLQYPRSQSCGEGPVNEVVVVDAARSAVGRREGALGYLYPPDTLGPVIMTVLERNGLSSEQVIPSAMTGHFNNQGPTHGISDTAGTRSSSAGRSTPGDPSGTCPPSASPRPSVPLGARRPTPFGPASPRSRPRRCGPSSAGMSARSHQAIRPPTPASAFPPSTSDARPRTSSASCPPYASPRPYSLHGIIRCRECTTGHFMCSYCGHFRCSLHRDTQSFDFDGRPA